MQQLKRRNLHFNLMKIVLLTIIFSFFFSFPVNAKNGNDYYPKLANFYLRTPILESQVNDLAKWDVLILHMFAQYNSADKIKEIRQKNPKIIILAYIPSEEFPVSVYKEWESNSGVNAFSKLLAGITPDMWLKDSAGNHVTFWKDFWMLNVSNYPTTGRHWNDYLSSFVAENLMGSNLWDGVFYDNSWTGIYWINQGKIDINNDGNNENKDQVDSAWQAGMKTLFRLTKEKSHKNIYIVGNGDRGFYGDINGLYVENFTDDSMSWSGKMNLFRLNAKGVSDKNLAILGNTDLNMGNPFDFQRMRYGLTSALLEGGYYAFDNGSNSHAENWWYDEYEVNLGQPVGESFTQNEKKSYSPDVWERNYTNGLAIANSTASAQTVELGDDYEKIHGVQDKTINDGSIVNEVTVGANDGLILLKTFTTLQDVLFNNGSFVRFFRADGSRVRNGFFIFEQGFEGGEKIAHLDFNGDGERDLLVVEEKKITLWRSDQQLFLREYPYGIYYKGELKVALGDYNNDGKTEVLVAPSPGYNQPIKIYSYSGKLIKEDWYPLGKKYNGGYSVAVRRTINGASQLVVGVGTGKKPEVYIYDNNFNLIKKWLAFETKFVGGVNVATGDLYGKGEDSIIVAPMSQKKPEISVFDVAGKLLSKFVAYQALGLPGLEIVSANINSDNKDEIISMSAGL